MLILGTHCPSDKAVVFSLQALFGLNKYRVTKLCASSGLRPGIKLKLNNRRFELNKACRDHVSTGLLKIKQDNIKRYVQIKHYKGLRHMFGLPCRGQRTRTNASTAKKLSIIKQNVAKALHRKVQTKSKK